MNHTLKGLVKQYSCLRLKKYKMFGNTLILKREISQKFFVKFLLPSQIK